MDLTLMEFEILRELLLASGEVVTRKKLLSKLWDSDYYGGERLIDTHIKNIRKKLGDDDCIETVRGVGYKIPRHN
jgi:two-component system response regulator VanR